MKRARTPKQALLPGAGKLNLGPRPARRYFEAVRLEREAVTDFTRYPFSIPSIRHLTRLEFHPAVTFFIGENGSGKSTLLEAIAVRAGFSAEGGDKQLQFVTHDTHSPLHECLRLERSFGRPTDGFFLRAESFYNVASELETRGSSFRAYGGKPLHEQSHGESFLAVMKERLQGGGVYLFDEPEAALSPQRQLSVLTLMHRLVHHQSQLVIATHSPILLAYPNARIFQFAESGISEIKYADTQHFLITRDFLNRHERMLEILLNTENADLESTQWNL
ncbi:MAG: AAA family ATPase [Verrucomicrobia bacterium]|nr:AAA family ATPase [Verrucomicrobiota bacterium]